jgi:preprotein translocase subunit SecG
MKLLGITWLLMHNLGGACGTSITSRFMQALCVQSIMARMANIFFILFFIIILVIS